MITKIKEEKIKDGYISCPHCGNDRVFITKNIPMMHEHTLFFMFCPHCGATGPHEKTETMAMGMYMKKAIDVAHK